MLISTYANAAQGPAGDNAAGIALQSQLKQLSQTLSQAAATHQTTALASQAGSTKSNASNINEKEAPAKAMHTSLKGMVSSKAFEDAQADAGNKVTAAGEDKVPHSADASIQISARAGIATTAGQDIHIAAAEVIHFASGQDTHIATGGAARIHTGQSIGMLAGAVEPGKEAAGKGITVIAGKGNLELQAQAANMQIASKQNLSIQSKTAHIDWAAAKKITLATAGGASVTIEGGNITVMGPGKITIKAGKRSFVGPEKQLYGLPLLPSSVCVPCMLKAAAAGSPFAALQ